MADESQAQPADAQNPSQLDPAFFDCVNEYLDLTNKQARQQGAKRISLASLYAAARFNAYFYLTSVPAAELAGQRTEFLDYMATMYRRMLNEHLDGMGHERNLDVGESELAADYAAAGVQLGQVARTATEQFDTAAAGATPPAASNE